MAEKSPRKIAAALAELYPNQDFNSFLTNPEFATLNKNTSVWSRICRKILPFVHPRTLRKNIRRYYAIFRNKVHIIRRAYTEIIRHDPNTEKQITSDFSKTEGAQFPLQSFIPTITEPLSNIVDNTFFENPPLRDIEDDLIAEEEDSISNDRLIYFDTGAASELQSVGENSPAHSMVHRYS